MRRNIIKSVKFIIPFLATSLVVYLVVFPLTEGRAENLDLLHIYFDPYIIFMYVTALPVFAGLFHFYNLLSELNSEQPNSNKMLYRLTKIRQSSFVFIFLLLIAELVLFISKNEEANGPMVLGFLLIAFSLIVIKCADLVAQKYG